MVLKGEIFLREKTKRYILIREDVQWGQTEPCWTPALHFVRINAFNTVPLSWWSPRLSAYWGGIANLWGKNKSLNKWCWDICLAIWKEIKLALFFTPHSNINSRGLKELNVKKEKTRRNCATIVDLGMSKDFINIKAVKETTKNKVEFNTEKC